MFTETVGYQSPLMIIYNQKCGVLSDLERELGSSTVRQFEAMGMIKNAPSPSGDTWKISAWAEKLGEMRSRPYTAKDKFRDFYRYKLPKMLFGA